MNDNHFPISNFCFGNVVNPKRQCKFWLQGLNLRGFSFSSVLEFSFWSRSFSHKLAMILTLQLWHFFVRRESRANNWLNFVFWNGLFSNFYRNLVCESFALIAATATHVTVNVHQLEKYLEKTMKFFFQTANCWESEWTNFLVLYCTSFFPYFCLERGKTGETTRWGLFFAPKRFSRNVSHLSSRPCGKIKIVVVDSLPKHY